MDKVISKDELLTKYKNYDHINSSSPLVKIFVGYIKPSFLFKTNILTPIHLGRAIERESSKDGEISEQEISWLHKNCIGDDDFDGNISNVNRRIGFLTGTYKAWKTYSNIGNPKYFGFYGYRKLFAPDILEDLPQYDIILPEKFYYTDIPNTKKRYLEKYGSVKLYDTIYDIIKKLYPQDLAMYEKYFNLPYEYPHEIYIMKKDIFFNFCEWIFPILFEVLKKDKTFFNIQNEENNIAHQINRIKGEKRDLAHIFEKITGYYLHKMTLTPGIQFKHTPIIQFPAENTFLTPEKIIASLRKHHLKAEVQ